MGKKRRNVKLRHIVIKCDMIHAIFFNFQKGLNKIMKLFLQNMFSNSDERARKS